MFTKYNGINLPKNYSGTKFKQSYEDTQMKTHRASVGNAMTNGVIRTSVSPSFQGALDKAVEKAEELIPSQRIDDAYSQSVDDAPLEECLTVETENEPTNAECDMVDACVMAHNPKKDSSSLNFFSELGFDKLLKNIGKDDLLLIALIILFAQEHLQESLDAIVILALLLLYH